MSKHVVLATLAALAWTASASAQTKPHIAPQAAAGAVTPAPRAFPGFTHPNITQCQTINPSRRECVVPANVAGHYVVDAVGVFTATGPNPTVAMNIIVGDQVCIFQSGGKFTGRAPLHLVCETTLATDAPIKISVNVGAQGATLDPSGPLLQVVNQPWDGVISVRGADGGALQTAKPQPAPSPQTPVGKALPTH